VDAQPQVAGGEREVALDIARRGTLVAPLIVLVAGVASGWNGVASAGVAIGIVVVNFLAAAAIITRAGRSGPAAVGAAALGGYIVRLGAIFAALFLLQDQSWIDLPTLGVVLVGTHLGLLFWEMKYVSLSLAAPGLRPARPGPPGEQ
jgi:hypothetical protein